MRLQPWMGMLLAGLGVAVSVAAAVSFFRGSDNTWQTLYDATLGVVGLSLLIFGAIIVRRTTS